MEKMYFKVPVLLCKKIWRVFCRDKHVCQEDCTKEGANNLYTPNLYTPSSFLYKMMRAGVCFKASKCRDYAGRLVAA